MMTYDSLIFNLFMTFLYKVLLIRNRLNLVKVLVL